MRKQIVENLVYQSIIGYCEELEAKGGYKGNGHHLAQKLTHLVSVGLLPKEKKKIFDVLTSEPQPTKDIADKLGVSSKAVSAQLSNMSETTLLVHSKEINKRRKMWYK